MLHDLVDDPGSHTPDELHESYEDALVDTVETHGVERVAAESGVDRERLEELLAGESPELELAEAASILATREDAPDAETIATLARDELLMGMTTAVLDVEAVESGLEGRLDAREIQSKIEGRFPMTLREFALLQQFIAGEDAP